MSTQRSTSRKDTAGHPLVADVTPVEFPEAVPVRAYYKGELAKLYDVHPGTLVEYINRFIEKFEALGYRRHDKRLTKRQVELLFYLIGEP